MRIDNSRTYFDRLAQVLAILPADTVDEIAIRLVDLYNCGRTLFVFGNGGSAALASHMACDLGKGTVVPGSDKRLRVIALTDNIPTMTAWANDSGYDAIFSEQLDNLVAPDDIVLAISCSGSSPNVLRALQVARLRGAFSVGLTGFAGGQMKGLCDLCLVVPSENMQHIEDLHLTIAHAIFTVVRQRILASSGLSATAAA